MAFTKWKSFVNVEKELLGNWVGEILTESGFDYTLTHGSPAIMYDGSKTTIFDIRSPVEIKIRLVRAVADPITRFFMGLAGGVHKTPATLIEIYRVSKENEGQVKDFVSRLLERLPGDPWDLKDHPMFARSALLRLRVKKRWMRWLD